MNILFSGAEPPDENNKRMTKLEALLDAAVDAIITIDKRGIIQSVNRSAEKMFNYEADEFRGKNVSFLMPEPWRSEHDEYIQRYQKTGRKQIIGIGREVKGLRSDGSVFPMHLSVSEYWVDSEVFFTGIVHDLTTRKRAEAALNRAQKMEAVGQLTGGIAHDFNNLLAVITGNLELLEMQLSDAGQAELLKEALEAADMGAELTERLLAFARKSVLEPEIVDLGSLIQNLSNLLKRTVGRQIALKTSLEPALWPAKVDSGQVESAILNLVVNARDAMPNGGSIVIETKNVVLDEDYTAFDLDLSAGEYVRISVSDTGEGMSEEIAQRAIEPFFTTKGTGNGTGLGLSMVYGFARQSGGNITIYSETELGTTVNVYLPRHIGAEQTQGQTKGNGSGQLPQGAGEKILVVEDDPRVRRLTLQRLEALGYETIEARDGTDGLKQLATNTNIALVFTDLVMPGGISGYDLADEVRTHYPEIRVLLTSGYAEDLVNTNRLNESSIRLIRKPYKQKDLAILLREVLDS